MPTETSPTARALLALEILHARPGTTAEELGQRLGVTERAARRYVGILREAGIPVEAVRGPRGGYRLGRGTRLPPVVFTQAEALSLVMAVLDSHPAASDGTDSVGSALGKVIRALPDSVGRQAAALREHAATARPDASVRPDPTITSTLIADAAAHRSVTITYRAEHGRQWCERVDPWAVVVRRGRWYLLCHSHRAQAVRTYRLDRIATVEPTGYGFQPPADLDPVAALEENLGTGWEFQTRVVFDAPQEKVAPWVGPAMGRLEPHEGGCVLIGSTSNPAMYAQEWLANLPFDFRVEGGPELRAAMATLVQRLAASLTPPPDRSDFRENSEI